MKLKNLFCLLLALVIVSNSSQGEGTSSALTTSFSNMEGSQGEDSSVVFSDRSGAPILKNTGYVAIGTFKLSREQIELLSSASDLNAAFYQFGAATNFNSIENGAFQGSASGNPSDTYDGVNSFAGSEVYIVIGNGSDLITSSEFLVWDSGLLFDGTGPTGGPWEVVLSVDSGDLIIGLSDKNTSDFSLIGGDAVRGAFTTVMIDEALDDHGNSQESATFIMENSTTSGKIDDGADVDYFRVDLSEDGNLFVKINQNLQLNLYDSEGVLIEAVQDAGDGLGGGVAADFMVSKDLAAGTYYVSIGGDQNTSDVSYNLENVFEEKIIDLDLESAGSYYGLVKMKEGRAIGHLKITITQDGAYSGQLYGLNQSSQSIKGFIKPDYSATTLAKNVFGELSSIDFKLIRADSGYHRISGDFQPTAGADPDHYFQLHREIYDSDNPISSEFRGRYTMLIPIGDKMQRNHPSGDGFAVGSLRLAGKLKLRGYSNSGAKFSYSRPMLEGHHVTVYTRPDGGLEALLGEIKFRDKKATDFAGWVRWQRKASSNDFYRDGFVKRLAVKGSKYKKPGRKKLPLDNFTVGNGNAIAQFSGGDLNGVRYPVTWKTGGSMLTPSTPAYRVSAVMKKKKGFFLGELVVSPEGEATSEVKTYLRGVVLQKKGIVSGHAETENSGVGRYSIVPAP